MAGAVEVYNQAHQVVLRREKELLRERWFGTPEGLLHFAWEAVKTKDEHDHQLKALPREFYLEDYFRCFIEEQMLFVLKSRQIMITWATFVGCLWETLRQRYSTTALVPKKDEDGELHIEDRIRKTLWPSLPEWVRNDFEFSETKGLFALKTKRGVGDWSSWIMSIARGEDQLRQHTLSRIFWDEMAFQELARRAWQAAMPTIGSRGAEGGRVVAVSTMLPGSFHDTLFGSTDKDTTTVDRAIAISLGIEKPDPDGFYKQPGIGICHYRNHRRGALCVVYSFLADSEKRRPGWELREARRLFGGIDTPEWQLDYRMQRGAFRGVLAFPHFGAWNIVPERPVNREAEIFLSFDFGHTNPTACLMWEWDAAAQTMTCFGEVYQSATEAGVMKRLIQLELATHLRLAIDEVVFTEVLGDNVGDPAGASFMLSYAQQPNPLHIRGNPPSDGDSISWRINTPKHAGEARLDNGFRRSFVCCGTRQYPEAEAEIGKCAGMKLDDSGVAIPCQREHVAKPAVVIMEGRAPNLVSEIPKQKRIDSGDPSLESTEKANKGVPNHSSDSALYCVNRYPQFLEIEPEAPRQARYLTTPAALLTTQDAFWREKHELAEESSASRETLDVIGEIGYADEPDGDYDQFGG